ncbi:MULTISPECIES: hypothetical protein [unclassified Streptomyces]|uniref:hypothetical protein n=1 Tax=unclassified Streptomyces TaxID=2593676 RepID=UPI000DAEBBA9|nr:MULTISPECIES: hypothetical protein [unclassified Streptomyces]PZT76814.1 hypothetical protein DNK56_26440 [Streptomyces sp. AC1-42W]PZT79233.1 hypothetical protein DNK55_06240 [Streptomyces sp. AC1-42T]
MTPEQTSLTRIELAECLTDAAQSVSSILTTDYPTAASRSYLHPVLGPLAAGPRVIGDLNDRFERLVAAEASLVTPAGLFTLASYASALGWLTESVTELTASVEQICTRTGIPTKPDTTVADRILCTEPDDEFDFAFSALELAAIRTAAEAAALTPGDYVEVLCQALLAGSRITDDCMEISSGLIDDAAYVLDEASDHVRTDDGPGSLPTLVRSLLTRMEPAK